MCRKTIAANGSSSTNVFQQPKSHPLQDEEFFKLCMPTSSHTPKKTLNKTAVIPVTVLCQSFL